ncbi:MAG: ubiquitin-conjugating enzyme E2 [Candidatus Electrothrix scaldis]|nr:MAG: ubiquitin-conjugating enzyme E2 [Candidatus Electrothrix sp. GW3-3]
MASEKDQLVRDFEEINKLLAQYPQIHIEKTEGSPPATYEISYQLKGLTRQKDGRIDQADRHLLRINLPFGYPHFPPTVKPLTPLFHPDIDPDAVRIASHWQQHPSLAQLVLHIGEMICAHQYTLEEPFNQEAADWYSEHTKDFPLDEIQQGDADFQVGELSMEGGEDELSFGLELDIPEQKQEEQQDDFDLNLEIKDTPEEDVNAQLEEVQYHIDRNEVVTASKLLADLSSSSPEAQNLKKTVSTALANRDKLLRKIEELENEDRFADAYKIFKKVQAIAVDTPALSDIGQRLQQSQAMLDAFAQPKQKQKTDEQKSLPTDLPPNQNGGKKKKKTPPPPPNSTQQGAPPKAPKPSRPPIEIPIKPILIGLTLLALGGGATFLYTSEMDKMIEIERKWIEIKYQRPHTPDQFKQKHIQAEQLLITLKSVHLPGLGKEKLETEILDLINSPELKKGESGDKEYKGVPLPAPLIKKLIPIDENIVKAAKAAEKKRFSTALSLYQDALTLAENAKPSPLDPQFEIMSKELDKRTQDIKARLAKVREQKQKEKRLEKRQQAEKKLIQSLLFFEELKKKNNSSEEGLNIYELWKECTKRLMQAEQLLNDNPEINSQKRQEKIKTFLAYSRLYQYLEAARAAYEQGDFAKAIEKYQSALDLLDEERVLFDTFYKEASKIRKTILMLNISIELRKAVEEENQNNLKSALTSYKKILKIIRTSEVEKDDTLKKLERYIRSKIDEQSLKAAKSSNQEWWQKNYERIFTKEFPSIRPSLLSKPRIEFVKIEHGRLLYIIRCSERGIGFELTYQYNLATGKWSPYREKL